MVLNFSKAFRNGALALLLAVSGALAAQAEPLIFVHDYGGLRPVARWQNNTFQEVPSRDPALQTLGETLLGTRREFPLFLNGEIQNYFYPRQFYAEGENCTRHGLWTGQIERTLQRPLLALSTDFPGTRRYIGNYPDQRMLKAAVPLAQKAFRRRGLAASALKRYRTRQRTAFTLENGTRYFVAIEAEIMDPQKPCPEASLLLVLEKVGRQYRERLNKYRHNSDGCGTYRFVSSFATGKRVDHLMIQGLANGARWYDIYGLQKDRLVQRFHGGGHNCPLPQVPQVSQDMPPTSTAAEKAPRNERNVPVSETQASP